MAFARRPEPCMPTPMMPKRTRSLGGTALEGSGIFSGSRIIVRAATYAPVAPALRWRNSRRGKNFFFFFSWCEIEVEKCEIKEEKTKTKKVADFYAKTQA